MAASPTDKFTEATNGTRPSPTTLTAIKSIGAASLSAAALTGWPTATAVHFILYNIDTSNAKIAGTQSDWKGVVSGTSITNLTLKAGNDANYAIGTVVEAAPTAAWATDIADGILVQHSQDGTHGAVTATSLSVSGTTTLPTNSITAANLATSAITLGYAQITTNFTTSSATPVQVTGLTTTVTIPAGGRRIKITAYTGGVFNSGINSVVVSIWDGVVNSGTQLSSQNIDVATAGRGNAATAIAVVTPSAGSKTYNVGLLASAGTSTLEAAATYPAFILVEAI